jgi:transposase
MAVPLNTCTTIEQRGVVRFLWAKGMAAKDIHKEMLPMYGEHCLSRQAVHNWVQKFSEGRTSTEDENQVGRPVEITTPATLQCVEDIIRAERRVTIDAAAITIGCSHLLLPYLLPTKTAQHHTVLSWYKYSGEPPSCNWCSIFRVMRIRIIAHHNKTR